MDVVLSIDAIRFPLTGIGRYVHELAVHLPREAGPGERIFYQRGGTIIRDGSLPGPDESGKPTAPFVAWLKKHGQNYGPLVSARRALSAHRQARALADVKDAVFHGPQFFLPRHAGPKVVTIHDLSIFSYARYHPPGRVRMMEAEIRNAVATADRIITDSAFGRAEVAAFFGLPETRIDAVALAAAACFHPRPAEATREVLAALSLEHDAYCLYSGTIEPRKNIEGLLDAYERLPRSERARYPLVLCGYQGWHSENLHRRMERAQAEGWLRYLGFVPAEHLPALFAGARLFAFPSHYEGFGLPVIEAMASGVPVVCSNAACLPEVAGDAAAMCAPDDIDALSALIERGLSDETWRRDATAKGLTQAGRFSFARCARETLAVYRHAAHG